MNKKLLRINLLRAKFFGGTDSGDEDDIFSKVKIYRTPSTKTFEIIVGALVLCIFLLNVRNFILDTSDDRLAHLAICGLGVIFPLASLRHSYHPAATDLPMKIVNARQVQYLSLCGRFTALILALFFLWLSCNSLIESETLFFDGMMVCVVLLFLNCAYFMYKIYKIRNYVEVKPEPTVKNEGLLCIGGLVAVAIIDFLLHKVLRDMPGGSFLKGVLIDVITLLIIISVVWICRRYFGLFKEIAPEEKEKMNKKK